MSDNESSSNRENKKNSRKKRESVYTTSGARKYTDKLSLIVSVRNEQRVK